MTTLASSGTTVLADRLVTQRSVVTDSALVAAGVALTALLAQISIPLWPVPVTGQTLAVLVVGASLGAVRGAASLAVYAALGAGGLPIFSERSSGLAILAGHTGGYIVGFMLAAGLTGWLDERRWDRRFFGATVAMAAGTLMTFAIGLPWLHQCDGRLVRAGPRVGPHAPHPRRHRVAKASGPNPPTCSNAAARDSDETRAAVLGSESVVTHCLYKARATVEVDLAVLFGRI